MDTFVFFLVLHKHMSLYAYSFWPLGILKNKKNKKNHVYIVYVIDKYTKDCSWITD